MKTPLPALLTMIWMASLVSADGAHPGAASAADEARDAPSLANYATSLRRVGDTMFDEKLGLTTVFVNELAGSVSGFTQERYPDGSVIVMEFAEPRRDGEGELVRDARGQPVKASVDYLAVMRRVAGFGEVYGAERAGEWEFSTYRPDGSLLIAPAQALQCASCHRKAGAAKDFVYRIRDWNSP